MGHTKLKIFIGIIFTLLWVVFLFFAKSLAGDFLLDPSSFLEPSKMLLLFVSLPLFFIWLVWGVPLGIFCTIFTIIFIMLLFDRSVYVYSAGASVLLSFLGFKLHKNFEDETKEMELSIEKLDEAINLLSQKIKRESQDDERMRASLKKTTYLRSITEDYSRTIYEEDILDLIVKNAFELFPDANRVLLYAVDPEKQELKLVRSKKRDSEFPIKAKKGDLFDRWLLKHDMPLLVQDARKDFRFSVKEELDEGFSSIISTPLISENKTYGLLRIDSKEKNKFTQSDLRFLDIMADLSSVSLQNANLYKKVQDLAIHDSLTGLYVHKFFVERLRNEVKRSLRNNINLTLLMLDIDNFKSYNDKYGHNAGDMALRQISSVLKSFADPGDIVGRYGGEEFTLLLLNKDKKTGESIAEKIRDEISKTPLVLRREETSLTVSIGVASCPTEARMTEDFLRLVDSRLYKAKESGRNKVCAK